MTAKARFNVDGLERVRVILVHSRDTSKMARYDEVTPGREREILRHMYVERDILQQLAAGAGVNGKKSPAVIEVTLRVVDPKELKRPDGEVS